MTRQKFHKTAISLILAAAAASFATVASAATTISTPQTGSYYAGGGDFIVTDGATFTNNTGGYTGFELLPGATATVNGGLFDNNSFGITSFGDTTITGGTFEDSAASDVAAGNSGIVYVTGGSFGPTSFTNFDVENGGTIDLYGNWVNGSQSLTDYTGTFTGTLEDNSASQTYSFNNTDGTINLIEVTPEPASLRLLPSERSVLGALLLKARKRSMQ